MLPVVTSILHSVAIESCLLSQTYRMWHDIGIVMFVRLGWNTDYCRLAFKGWSNLLAEGNDVVVVLKLHTI